MATQDCAGAQPETAADLPADGLDAEVAAAERVVWRLTFVEFPWDINKALEFALLRTYAVPSISGLLARTGEFKRRPRQALRRHRPADPRGAAPSRASMACMGA
jgi:hypothetical protein